MMASSSLSSSCTEQTTAVVSPSESSSIINHIHVHIDQEVKKKIISTLHNLPLHDGESVLVLFWAAEEIKKYIFLLTTTFQPFLLSGNNKELHAYRLSCLYNKLYVYRDAKEEAAFGLAGMAYLYCTPQQTQNVHEYLRDHSPTCEHASFTKKWGSYAIPVTDANKCVGVLEVVTDTPRNYSKDITVAKEVLEHAGLQTTMQIDSIMRTYIYPKERSRITFTSPINSYCCLNKYFGLSSVCAAKALEGVIKHPLPESTFRNLCRSVGILEWPCIRPCIRKTTDTRSFVTLNDDLISNPDEGLSGEEIMTTISSAQEIRTNPFASEASDDTGDWNESEFDPDHAHPSLMATIGDLMENQDNNIYPTRVRLDSMDIDHLRADPLWCEKICDRSCEHTMTSDSEAWLSGFAFPYNNAPVANHGSMDDIGDFDIASM